MSLTRKIIITTLFEWVIGAFIFGFGFFVLNESLKSSFWELAAMYAITLLLALLCLNIMKEGLLK
jgi:hypothetical protein